MHETRNFVLVIVLVAALVWGVVAWFVLGAEGILIAPQRIGTIALAVIAAAWLLYAFTIEDKMPNHLKNAVGPVYYEADGICFLPIIRMDGNQAEICVYYQNRFENPAQAIVHLRPTEEAFVIKPGLRDVHFAFKADGGDYGVIRQPIAVPRELQGQVVHVEVAAASYYPRSHGARLRGEPGIPCGTMVVDWGGAAFKTGVHEVSGEIELHNTITLHLSMPTGVAEEPTRATWKQERLVAVVA